MATAFVRVRGTEIHYEIRRRARSRSVRLTVRADRVTVTAPRFTLRRTIEAFVEAKRNWIHDKQKALREREVVSAPRRFVDGASIPYRGRSLALRLRTDSGDSAATESGPATLRFANAFHVTVAAGLTDREREQTARRLVMSWLEERVLQDAQRWSRQYADALGVAPRRIRVGNQKTLWGSCSARGTISLNWRLIAMPKPIFEYVVVHELCHLVEHNHGPGFWKLVASLLPDYRDRRAWLRQRGIGLD
jgi:predicted metal-dependent hydrolase